MNAGSTNSGGNRGPAILLLSLTLLNVGLQLASAALIKFASMPAYGAISVVVAMLAGVLALNAGRFLVWNAIHKRYPISLAYPLSALFFPAVVAFAWFMDEPVGTSQMVGALLVMIGVAWILVPNGHQELPVDV